MVSWKVKKHGFLGSKKGMVSREVKGHGFLGEVRR